MANTYTSAIKLAMPAQGDRGWNTPVNGNSTAVDAINSVGDLAVTTKEIPSVTLNVAVAPGLFVNQSGVVTTYTGSTSQTMTASTTNYVYLTGLGALTVSTSGFPSSPTAYIPLATVVTGSSTITSVTDQRACYSVVGSGFLPLTGGTMVDGANITLGTSSGTKIGTSTGQKIGFLGTTPVSQQTGGSATASASWTSTEEGMLNRAYAALRAYGLLS